MNEYENINTVEKKVKSPKKPRRLDIVGLVLCLIAAIGIWLYVTNSNQTVTEKTIFFTIDAEKQIQEDTGLSIIVGNDKFDYSKIMVELTVSGTQSALNKYKDTDYQVKIDTLDLDKAGKYNLMFRYTLPGDDVIFKSVTSTVYLPPVLIDTLETKEIPLFAEYGEGGVSSGVIEKITPKDRDKISVMGPKSIIDDISHAIVYVNLAGYEKSTDIKSKTFEFMDVTGAVLNNDYSYIKVNPSEIDVHVQINYVDKNVPINVRYTATDTDQYKYMVTLQYADNTDAVLPLTGDSVLFDNTLVYDLGNITDMGNTTLEITVGQLLASNGFLPEGLKTNADKDRKLLISIVKEKIETGEAAAASNGETNE